MKEPAIICRKDMLPYYNAIETFQNYFIRLAVGINALKNLSLFLYKEGKLGAVSVLPAIKPALAAY